MLPPPQPRRPLLTQIAHRHLIETVRVWRESKPAGTQLLAIDATAGNGHDTLFLAELLGQEAEVAAFDIQPQALENTQARLLAYQQCQERCPQPHGNATAATHHGHEILPTGGTLARVQLIQASHARMTEYLPTSWQGAVCAITFNLGYLPGGDKARVTLAESTLPALASALQLLAPGGLLSVLCYRGHSEGSLETEAIHEWLATLPHTVEYSFISATPDAPPHAPLLLHIRHKTY